ncbi:MAG: hypothetical protein K2O05_00985, partial [Anaeroplasmataceae bacterium]|nr:hypothetical protein [Anaeroplasmataceae bacterium]
LSDFDTNNIVIKESMVEPLTVSEILCTTLSKYLADSEDVMIPCESAYLEKMVQGNEQYILYHSEEQKELQSILYTLIDVFGTDILNTGEKSVVIKDINTENLILNLETKEKVKESKILQATLSHYITDSKDTGLIIPADNAILNPMEIIGFDGLKNVIEANELDSLLDSCFQLFGEGDTLKVNEIKSEHVMIDKEKIKHITNSKIMNTTIMDSMLNDEDLIVPAVENRIVEINQLMDPNLTCVIVEKDEIDYLLNSLIDMIGTDGVIDASAIQISHIHITSSIDVSRSEILSATLGNKILGVDEFDIPRECVLSSVTVLSKKANSGTKDLINVDDLSQLLDSIFCLVNELNIDSGQSDLNMDDIVFTKDNIPTILSSVILEYHFRKNVCRWYLHSKSIGCCNFKRILWKRCSRVYYFRRNVKFMGSYICSWKYRFYFN